MKIWIKRGIELLLETNRIEKTKWLIRDILPGDANHMTFLLGTNYDNMGAWKKERFYDIKTREGARILMQCTLSAKDYNRIYRPIDGGWNDEATAGDAS